MNSRTSLLIVLVTLVLGWSERAWPDDDDNRLQNIADAAGQFNERGYLKSNSFSLSGNEVIGDFAGNLIYTQRLLYLPVSENGLHCDLKLAYNGNVGHTAFGARQGLNGIMQTPINLPEWILSVNGIGVQTFNFENELVTWRNDTSSTADASYTDDIAAHVEGYHKCYRVRKAANGATNGVISILLEDGSIKELYSMDIGIEGPAFMIGGEYSTCSKDDPDRGYLWSSSDSLHGFFTLFRSDGTQVLFQIFQPIYKTDLDCDASFPKGRADYPRILLPVEFRDQMGHAVELHYSFMHAGMTVLGRPFLDSIGEVALDWDDWNPGTTGGFAVVYRGVTYYRLYYADGVHSPHSSGRGVSWIPTSRANRGLVWWIRDSENRSTEFSYRTYQRTFANLNFADVLRHFNVCNASGKDAGASYQMRPWRLWAIHYPDGGHKKFSYIHDEATAWGNDHIYTPTDTITVSYDHTDDCLNGLTPLFPCRKSSFFDQIGRDPFFLNMVVAAREFLTNGQLVNTDSLDYTWNGGADDDYCIVTGDIFTTERWFSQDTLWTDYRTEYQQLKHRRLEYHYFPENGLFSKNSRDRGWSLKMTKSVDNDWGRALEPIITKRYAWDIDCSGNVCTGTFQLDTLRTSHSEEHFTETYEYEWLGDPGDVTVNNIIRKTVTDPWGIRSETYFSPDYMNLTNPATAYYNGSIVDSVRTVRDLDDRLLTKAATQYYGPNAELGYNGQVFRAVNYLIDDSGVIVDSTVTAYAYLKGGSSSSQFQGGTKWIVNPNQDTTFFVFPSSTETVTRYRLADDGTLDTISVPETFVDAGPFWFKSERRANGTSLCVYQKVDDQGRLLWTVEPNGYQSEIAYDNLGRATAITLPGGYVPAEFSNDTAWSMKLAYDDEHAVDPVNVQQSMRVARDEPEQRTKAWFDGLSRATLSESLGADGSSDSVVTEHDYAGRVCAVRDQLGHITTSAYDFLDRPVSTHFPDPAHSSDSVKYSVSNAATVGLTTLFSFPEDIVFIKECLDENGHVVREVTDVRGKLRLRQSYDSTNAIVTYFDYDDLGNLTRVIKPNGDEVRYKYNSFGQLIEEEAADLLDSSGTGNYGRITYEYDKNGNLIRKQDATLRAGSSSYTEKIYYDYDALDRITASGLEASQGSQSSKTPVSRYFYDQLASELSVGRLSLVFTSDLSSRSNYAERYHYDGRGRVKRQVNYFQAVLDSTYVTGTGWVYSCHGDSMVVRYTYDWADQLRSITYADGSIVRYDYDERGRLTKVGGAEPGEVDRYARLTHTRRDELESMEIGGAIQHLDYAYNERGWLQSINDGVSGGAAPDDLFGQRLYYYDHPYSQMPWPAQYNGNVFCQKLSIAGDEKRFAHRYDKSDRLRESLIEAFEFESFNYDGNGNITFASKFTTEGTIAKDYRYAAGTNKLTVADRQHWLVDDTLTYDHNGNVIRHSGKKARFYFDILNRLVKTEISGSWGVDTVWYGYSAGGERIYKEYFYHFRRECSGERSGEERSRGPGEGDSTSLWCTDTARTFTYYVLGQGKVLAEQTSPAPSGAARRFIYAGGTRIAMRDASGKLHYYLSDH
ncbi:MAG: RHS repeat protein, partial [candidate division Zixibacteria bacterium]|nr:RHS repeat protein [candidate division Zixibacteria bacterium]